MPWYREKEKPRSEGFPHHVHYIKYCPSSSKSMIILFAIVLWEACMNLSASFDYRWWRLWCKLDTIQMNYSCLFICFNYRPFASTCNYIFTHSVQRGAEWEFIDYTVFLFSIESYWGTAPPVWCTKHLICVAAVLHAAQPFTVLILDQREGKLWSAGWEA